MNFMTDIDIRKVPWPIDYGEKIMLVGSCFTEHIGHAMAERKFDIMQNPNGILFDPHSVCDSLLHYIDRKHYGKEDLLQLDSVWHSWDHHSRFSHIDPSAAIAVINKSVDEAADFIREAKWLIITLGSSFTYTLTGEGGQPEGYRVANCHRAPSSWFRKTMLTTEETVNGLKKVKEALAPVNPSIRCIFTVSPVRHLRDGVVANNRSKARLIEAVHTLCDMYEDVYYFPAYELVIDILRDYRFYDIDLAHPNYQATGFVLEKFMEACFSDNAKKIAARVHELTRAVKHRPMQPGSDAHKKFREEQLARATLLAQEYPFLSLEKEMAQLTGDHS